MIANVRPCPPVPPLNLHGKEGVDGSSPSEGFEKSLQMGFLVVCPDAASAGRGYETGTFSDARPLAGTSGLTRPSRLALFSSQRQKLPASRWQTLPMLALGLGLSNSFARRGSRVNGEGQRRHDTSESCWKSTTFPWRPGRVAKLGAGFGD